jgi:hypothetical protein
MHSILDFTQPHTILQNQSRKNLRLILWAGDGEHDGISDVERLPNYDVYLCLGFRGPNFDKNVASLADSQTICIIDIHDDDQMARFHASFAGSFAYIDADYMGNTPTFPLGCYASLLVPNGRVFHTEGINGLRMPQEDLLNTLEIFAPVLSPKLAAQRRWSAGILEAATSDGISPLEVWTSPELKQPFYARLVENHQRFVQWQSERNEAWPCCADSLDEQWASLEDRVLTWTLTSDANTLDFIRPYLTKFSDHLSEKIERVILEKAFDSRDYLTECEKVGGDMLATVALKQQVLKWILREVPPCMAAQIGYYIDMRRPDGSVTFGLWYFRVPGA